MKIEMLRDVNGSFHNVVTGVRAGDVIEVDDQNGQRYCDLNYARPAGGLPVTVVPNTE
jgi:hypothetical protein